MRNTLFFFYFYSLFFLSCKYKKCLLHSSPFHVSQCISIYLLILPHFFRLNASTSHNIKSRLTQKVVLFLLLFWLQMIYISINLYEFTQQVIRCHFRVFSFLKAKIFNIDEWKIDFRYTRSKLTKNYNGKNLNFITLGFEFKKNEQKVWKQKKKLIEKTKCQNASVKKN